MGHSQESAVSSPGPTSIPHTRTYRRRWYILAVYALLGFAQCAIWNTFGPIAAAALAAFPSWNNTVVSMTGDVGCWAFSLCMAGYCWLLDRYGVRVSILTMAGLMAVGTALRCVSSDQGTFTAMAFVAAVSNGLSGIMAMAAPPYISELWFPPEQRTTATGVPNILNQLGGSAAFLIGPLLVRDPGNSTSEANAARDDIMRLMYVEAGVAGALFLAVLIYYPARPPLPPSISASKPVESFWQSLRRAIHAPDLPWVVGSYALSQGVQAAYFGVLTINVEPLGVTQDQAGWLGFWTGICCCGSAFVCARLTDLFRGHMKKTIVTLLSLATVCFVWLLALVSQWIPYSLAQLYCATLLSISLSYSTSPLLLEYAAELSYPVSPDVTGACMSFCYNTIAALYLMLFLVPGLTDNTVWLNYLLVLSTLLPAAAMLKTNEVYRRTNLDLGQVVNQSDSSDSGQGSSEVDERGQGNLGFEK